MTDNAQGRRPAGDPELGAVVALSRRMAGQHEPEDSLWLLVCALRENLGVDRAGVFRFKAHARELDRMVGVDRSGKAEFAGQTIPLTDADHPLMLVANRKIPYFLSNNLSSEFPHLSVEPGMNAIGIVPIVASNTLVGVLCVDNYLSRRPLSKQLVGPLHLYAGLAALPLFAIYQRQERERADTMRRGIYRDVFLAATSGKILLCTAAEMESEWPNLSNPMTIREERDVPEVRDLVRECAQAAGMNEERTWDLVLCTSEAVTNALLHGSGGTAHVERTETLVRVRVQDRGTGIALEDLPDAALRPGWSRGRMPSMGHGFVLMYKLADRVLLSTGPQGTTVILEMFIDPVDRLPAGWDALI